MVSVKHRRRRRLLHNTLQLILYTKASATKEFIGHSLSVVAYLTVHAMDLSRCETSTS